MPKTENNFLKKVTVYGYCSYSKRKLARLFFNKEEHLVAKALGNFVIVWNDSSRTVIITSYIGIIPYYYYFEGQHFVQGKEILDVFKSSKQRWEWDFQALADYLIFNHPIDSSTFHKKIKRTSANTILCFEDGKLEEKSLQNSIQNQERIFTSPYDSINCLKTEMARWVNQENALLSITGGFDSRLLLAVLLSLDIKPNLIVSGQKNSFDLEVSKSISKKFNLPLLTTEIKSSDIVENSEKTIRATGGMLPIPHWAGHLWAASYNQNLPIIVGFNGEFARSYYFDKGQFSYLLDYIPNFYKKAILEIEAKSELRKVATFFSPIFQTEFSVDSENNRFRRVMAFSGFNTLEKLDSFFIDSYTTNKTGMDIAALGQYVNWIAPFCSADWIKSQESLSRNWKLGSKFHRFAINELFPQLLSFPEEGVGNKMSLNPKPLYWKRKKNVIPFYDIQILEESKVKEIIMKGLFNLEDIMSKKAINLLVESESLRLKLLSYKLAPVGLFTNLLKNF
ncbi:hypothetical protein Xen7305DRAFT_00040260 [Xenococcus sp. PCC 7305]|uniref:hypothetical protein n=1 Tax=Xenococcus sp. PCC 7305 TaxID=102125 RepID=UPI0002AC8D70|nr:hypothetical protein [Xenococcus sp. PCC 7305]ELS04297.1 hypothetical protein Xen7305DRAFT_00040260 [Xenococcus sp. PCC 7305]